MVEDKIFIGGCREGNFHNDTPNQVDVILYLTGDDIKKITDHAQSNGKGTFENKEGKTVVPLRLKTSQGGKLYCEIDQFVPNKDKKQESSIPSQNAAEDSLPF